VFRFFYFYYLILFLFVTTSSSTPIPAPKSATTDTVSQLGNQLTDAKLAVPVTSALAPEEVRTSTSSRGDVFEDAQEHLD